MTVIMVIIILLFLDAVPAHLYGRTRFGCSARDEWYLVNLLRRLSDHDHDLVVRYVVSLLTILSSLA